MKIKITKFAKRHFDSKFGGTKILDCTPETFENFLNKDLGWIDLATCEKGEQINMTLPEVVVHDGYAPFCKLIAVTNFTDARVGSLPITLENYQYIRSGYSARTEKELPVFSRWLELPTGKPKAEWLMIVLYSKEQIEKEAKVQDTQEEIEFDADWGVVSIHGQSHCDEEVMKPETMLRNSGYGISKEELDNATNKIVVLMEKTIESKAEIDKDKIKYDLMNIILSSQGVGEGGSGVPLDKEKYLASVKFWSHNCTVK